MADLYRPERVFVHWPVSGVPDGNVVFEVNIVGDEWWPLTLSDDLSTVRLLLAGPDFVPADGDSTVYYSVTESNFDVRLRARDTPELPYQPGGMIRLLD